MLALLIYCRIDTVASRELKLPEVVYELKHNKKLIEVTSGDEDKDLGSDSGPSEDNLEEHELALIVPIEKPSE